uniref:Uncharacterized protein n=1 Tax=Cajanus cajan TaxID=3821 RepID=A0A151TWI2_CAJCA|nr:hypothetical protein KK1_010664 [Cajanus cajan]
MVVNRISPDVVTYNSLIYGFCIMGQLKEAFDLFKDMVLKHINPTNYTFNVLVDGLCKEGKVKEAKDIDIFNTMANRGVTPDVRSYTVMINGLCKIKMADEAMNFFIGCLIKHFNETERGSKKNLIESKSNFKNLKLLEFLK